MNNRADAAAIAAALSVTARAVTMRAQKEAWAFVESPVRGGRKRLYQIAGLPDDVQTALAGKALSAALTAPGVPPLGAPPVSSLAGAASVDALSSSTRGTWAAEGVRTSASGSTPDPRSESLAAWFEGRPQGVQDEARRCLEIVQEYARLTERGLKGTVLVEVITRGRAISEATLSRYLSKVRGEPEHLWLYLLAPRHAGRTAIADMSAEAWEVLKADYLRKSEPTARACVRRLVGAAPAKGWVLPSMRTMERRLEQLPKAVKVMARKGREEAAKLYPAQRRVKAALQALEIVNADGYAHKRIWVVFDDGEIRRAKTVFWQDVYSGKILAHRTDKTEHTNLYRLSFGDLVERFGIPAKAVLLDNTTAAANKTMSGGVPYRYRFKVKPEDPDGVFKLMGIERVMWATPSHGQAKPIERVFGIGGIGEYVDKAPEFEKAGDDNDTYNGKTRPILVAELEAVIAREVAALNSQKGRRSPLAQGRSFDEVFAESYAGITVRRATEHQRRLWLLCTEPVKVQRDATITLDHGRKVGEHAANRYWSRALQDYTGKLVAARFDPKRLHEGVHLYTVDGRYIAFGDCVDPAGFTDHDAAREHARDRGAMLRATREILAAERRMDARQAGATLKEAREAGKAAATSIPAPKLIQNDFRHPLERPRYVPRESSEAERAELEQLERDMAAPKPVNVLAMRSDADRHDYWKSLEARRAAGEALAEAEDEFWRHWQAQDYYRIAVEMDRDFEQLLAARQAAA